MKRVMQRYLPYLRAYRLQYFLVAVGIVMTVSATTATAQIMQPLMDKMFIARDETMLYLIPLGLVGIYFVKSMGRYIQTVYMNYIGQHMIARLRETLLEKILHLDMAFLYKNRSGELISRVTNDIGRIEYFVSNMLPELIREVLTLVALIGYVIYLNPRLAMYALVVVPLVIYPLFAIAKKLRKYSHRSQEKNADIVTRLTEVFNSGEIIKANATERYELGRFSDENWRFFKINMKMVYVGELVSPLMELLGAFGLAAVIFIGGREVYGGHMSVGEFTAFLTAVGLVFQPIRRIGSIYRRVQDAVAASERVFYILDLDNTVTDGPKVLDAPIHSISMHGVDLYYDDIKALEQIDFEARSGQNIALVGDSGGGKSSLINLIIRFYDATHGTVRINGEDIRGFTLHSLRDRIAIVSQRVYIMQDTLAENVAYGHTLDEARVIEALRLADAYDFAASLPQGIHTPLDEAGVNLSGGQRQRIAIARAIYKNASVLILDEATSALDNETEQRIHAALASYVKDKITITIAHRLSTVENADRLYVFKAGRIAAHGTYAELMERSEDFRRIACTYEA